MKIMTFGKLMLKILIVLLDFKISSNKNCICFSLIKNGSALSSQAMVITISDNSVKYNIM